MDEQQIKAQLARLTPDQRREVERQLRRRQEQKRHQEPIPIRQTEDGRFPLSDVQEGVWLGTEIEPAAYNDVRALRLTGALDVDRLRQSLNALLAANPILRIRVFSDDGVRRQEVDGDTVLPLAVVELPEGEVAAAVARLIEEPFDLTTDLLLRAVLYRTGQETCILVLIMHNLICDGESVSLLYDQLQRFYATTPGDPAARQRDYLDFAVWQSERQDSEAQKDALEYWKGRLGGFPTRLQIPSAGAGEGSRTLYQRRLSSTATAALRAFAADQGVTPFALLLSAYAALLFRYTAQEQLIIGTTAGNRVHRDTAEMVGFFPNLLPLPVSLTANTKFSDLAHRAQSTVLAALEHQSLPFYRIVQAFDVARAQNENPLVQVVITYKETPPQIFHLGTAAAAPIHFGKTPSSMPLTLEIMRNAEGLDCLFHYNPGYFGDSDMERMAGHLETLLTDALAHPDSSIANLTLFGDDEFQQLVYGWNDTAADLSPVRPVHELFEEQARQTPDHDAVIDGEERLTYAELNAAANRLAAYLRSAGVGQGVLSAVLLDRSLDQIGVFLAILKAGGAYIPVSSQYPPDRIGYMLQNSGTPLVITSGALRSHLPAGLTCRVLLIDDDADVLAAQPDTNLALEVETTDLVYVVYTSGSTGKPKGVMVEHGMLFNYLRGRRAPHTFTSSDTILASSAVGFDVFQDEIFSALTNGASLVILPSGYETDVRYRQTLIQQQQVTVMFTTPSLLNALLDDADPVKLTSLRFISIIGEAWTPDMRQRYREILPGVPLANTYGPTEATIAVTSEPGDSPGRWATIGFPFANTQLYVLDAALKPTPIAVSGMLYIGGDGVARGYLNRPDLTAERFIAHPLLGRLYETGDRARRLPDGNIEFLGRADFQVKLRGWRIELQEIESVLLSHADVREAVVTVWKDHAGDQRLVAYVVGSADAAALRAHLQRQLPYYMIPGDFVLMDAFPLNTNGKLNRALLPPPSAEAERPIRLPGTPLEQQLAAIWSSILDRDPISVDDDFFEIGGHSLKAAQICTRIKQVLGVDLRIITLFQAPTIAELARCIEGGGEMPESITVLLQMGDDPGRPPLFLIHGIGGEVMGYLPLVKYLRSKPTVYGLQARMIRNLQRLPTMDTLAADYVAEIRRIQPRGPYFLCGYSFGGLVAMEMARALQQSGEEVRLLGLFDTLPRLDTSKPINYLESRLRNQVARVRYHAAELAKKRPDQWMGYVRSRWGKFQDRSLALHQFEQQAAPSYADEILAFAPETFKRQHDVYFGVMRTYEPQPYPHDVTIFITDKPENEDFRRRWQRMVTGMLTFRPIQGSHITLIEEPHVHSLAASLDELL